MSEAREKYDFWVVMNHAWNIDDVINYVVELEQLLRDANERASMFEMAGLLQFKEKEELEQQITELKESQKQKQIIKLCERLDKAEQQNERMIEALRMIKHKLETDPAITDTIWIDDNPKCSETAVDRINRLLGIKE